MDCYFYKPLMALSNEEIEKTIHNINYDSTKAYIINDIAHIEICKECYEKSFYKVNK